MRSLAFSGKPLLVVGLGLAIAAGCSSTNAGVELPSQPGLSGTGGATTTIFDGSAADAQVRDAGTLNPLCGTECRAAGCFNCRSPDDPSACKLDGGIPGSGGASGGTGGFGAGGHAGTGGKGGGGPGGAGPRVDAGPKRDGSTSGFEGGAPADASLDRAAGGRDASRPLADAGNNFDSSGNGNGQTDAGPPRAAGTAYSCQVEVASSGDPFHQCLPAGTMNSGGPCTVSSDCRPGLACAGLANAHYGQCLPYCCDPTTSCDDAWVAGGGARAGTRLYCGERALIDGTYDSHADAAAHPRQVPVCVRAQPCGLGDPYPCTNGSCACRDGTACTVKVLPAGDAGGALQGTTACEVPGKGRTGDHCPPACAAGYFCSESSGVCLKMCEARTGDVTCAPGKCQVTAGFPPGWGVCVGLTPAAK